MIPKIIHYCWFGEAIIPEELQRYIDGWKVSCPDYEIKLWNEESFDVNSHIFTATAYKKRKFAYVSDFVRAYALNKFGGVYLDVDVELKQKLEPFLSHEAFTGFEKNGMPFTALWGSIANHSLARKVLLYYDEREYLESQDTNTIVISDILSEEYRIDVNKNEFQIGQNNIDTICIYPAEFFCLDLCNSVATHHFYGSWLPNENRNYKNILHNNYYLDKISVYQYNRKLTSYVAKNISFKELIRLIYLYVKYKLG
ncbi:glycosyltransferase family 32 protein [Acinetobacter sp. 1000160]|uniref:glycosyltransferase family 32 protein n=1 Tax=Acinetobacter sp. 1000160 TaxID=1310800 RepID=UPI00045138FA|nr:glycosyltransferase [Acinetobacter sp. 1000160]EXB48058.1 tcdA/TcdB catalytic glycosyltransferase domain protein [Acinetobacter baumannii 146457]EYT19843.1 tcdA/TcdB catalytic glycosyltransferase domain protein [Acinetobacter sp. 1000160]